MSDACPLCAEAGGTVVWQGDGWRAIRVDDADFPGFYRLIAQAHVAELTDLAPAERARCLTLVAAIERVLRERLAPTKVNLASLGNVVPHLHWHVIARFAWDSHFPNPIWGERLRAVEPPPQSQLGIALSDLDAAVHAALAQADKAEQPA